MADLNEQELKAIVEAARVQFDAAHSDREQALRAARLTIQLSPRAIRAAHRGEIDEARNLVKQAGEEILPAAKLTRECREFSIPGCSTTRRRSTWKQRSPSPRCRTNQSHQ